MGKVIWSPASSATVWSRRLTGPTVMVASSGSVGRTVNLHRACMGVHRACFRRSLLRSHSPWAQTAERFSLLILCSISRIAHQLASARHFSYSPLFLLSIFAPPVERKRQVG